MFRRVFGSVTFIMFLAVGAGCQGYSKEKATVVCDQERTAKAQCVTDASFDQCVACYQECGNGCRAQALCPEEYSCNDDEGDQGEGGAGGAAGAAK
jgi:hypothetical protein